MGIVSVLLYCIIMFLSRKNKINILIIKIVEAEIINLIDIENISFEAKDVT